MDIEDFNENENIVVEDKDESIMGVTKPNDLILKKKLELMILVLLMINFIKHQEFGYLDMMNKIKY